MNFRRATAADAESIVQILNEAKDFLRKQEIPQWQDLHFEELVPQSISRGEQYVLYEDGVLAAVCTMQSFEPDYQTIEGRWLTNGNYYAVHRVAVSSSFRGRGVTQYLYEELAKLAKENGAIALRADTHPKNLRMQRTFEKNQFMPCGKVTVFSGDVFLAYERELK